MRVDVQREESPIKEVQITLTGEEAKDLYRWMSTGKDIDVFDTLMARLRAAEALCRYVEDHWDLDLHHEIGYLEVATPWRGVFPDASLAIHLMDDLRRAGVKVA